MPQEDDGPSHPAQKTLDDISKDAITVPSEFEPHVVQVSTVSVKPQPINLVRKISMGERKPSGFFGKLFSNSAKEQANSESALASPDTSHAPQSPPPSRPASRAASIRRFSDKKEREQVLDGKTFSNDTAQGSTAAPAAQSHGILDSFFGAGMKMARRPSQAGSEKAMSERSVGHESTASLLKKYGVCDKLAIGKGATAVVRLVHRWERTEEKFFAVKEFRKRRKNESERDYIKKLTSEFCISSTLHHPNIIETVDLVKDEHSHWCEVMEYCPGGDLYAAIKKGGMAPDEIHCCWKQVLLGVEYLHSMGVAHRDLKPENLLLDGRGKVKITDFGVSDVFRMCWEKTSHMSMGLVGSTPYIAPELFVNREYDARLADVWACGIVLYCLQFQELPWREARSSVDTRFGAYMTGLEKTPADKFISPISNFTPRESRPILKRMLDPNPATRAGIEDILKDDWIQKIVVCSDAHEHVHTSSAVVRERVH